MKTNFHRKSSKPFTVTKIALIVAGILLVLWLLGGMLGYVGSFMTLPFRHAEVWFSESQDKIPSYFRDRNELIEQQRALERELATHSGTMSTIARLVSENEELRSHLSDRTSDRIAAGVIMRPDETPYDTMLIDKGSIDDIKERAIVYARHDAVIGVVRKVFLSSALVELVTSPGVISTAYIYGPNIYTEALGMGGGVLRVGVPQGIEFAVGNVVVLPSVSGGVFGTVSHIESSESSPEQFGFVTGEVPNQSVRLVSVSAQPLPEISFEDAQKIVEETRDELFRIDVPEEILVSTTTPTTTDGVLNENE